MKICKMNQSASGELRIRVRNEMLVFCTYWKPILNSVRRLSEIKRLEAEGIAIMKLEKS